ncbi:MAG: signal peptidase I [Candidatus Yonathbacteria bacterium]|nr:signal peptidase I [Candidatus Yonathbacteria bacterium]
MTVFLKIINGIFSTLFFGVAMFFLASFFPNQTGVMMKVVMSGSMQPAIRTGGIVVIRPAETYQVGDVITFGEDTHDAIPTTHRIVSVRDNAGATYYTTKGDANNEVDTEETRKDNVLGRVLVTVPYAGYILDFARQPLGFMLLVLVPASIIIIDEVLNIIEEIRKGRKKVQQLAAQSVDDRKDSFRLESERNESVLVRQKNLSRIDSVRPPQSV